MTVTYYPETYLEQFNPYHVGEVAEGTYLNKVWDTVANGWVFWTTNFEDFNGVWYPGPGTYGLHTSRYRVETVIFSE